MASYKPEADLNHQYISPDHRYACMNRPKPSDVWLDLEDKCSHTWKKTDPSCTDCKWR